MIYPRFNIPKGPDSLNEAVELHDRIIGAAVRASLEAGGIMNDHHGVGMRLAPYMEAQLGAGGMELLKGIKAGVDPKNILCPGKLALQ
jgi:alkyldihydroxyacetonephosphate synthase